MSEEQKKRQTKAASGNQALWGGRFAEGSSRVLQWVGQSIDYDRQLYAEDILGSLAHVTMLGEIGVLEEGEVRGIKGGLEQVYQEIGAGELKIDYALEDIHMHIESRLTEIIGPLGKKLHTGRSRNDQVSVDVHLYLKKGLARLAEEHLALLEDLLTLADRHKDTIFPGYTHLQVAQPIRMGHYFLAYFWKFRRDFDNLVRAYQSADVLTLGSGAMAGVNYPTDRELLARLLNFSQISANSMDAVSERDYQLDFLYYASNYYLHLSRLCEEVITYSSVEFRSLELGDTISTGSSIMPQKKNPDLAELLRGKAARVIGSLNRGYLLVKNLPLTYNRDLQEDKENLFDTMAQMEMGLAGTRELLAGVRVNERAARRALERGFATATDLADGLVNEKNISFREAHHIVGSLVGELARRGETLAEADRGIRSQIHPALTDDEFYNQAIDLARSADKKISAGGTGREVLVDQARQAWDSWQSAREGFQREIRRDPPAMSELLG